LISSVSLYTSTAPSNLTQAGKQGGISEADQVGKTGNTFKITNTEDQYSEEELALIAELKRRDREVRAHEQAHQAAAGPYASAPSFTYQKGPDGKNYAVGGEVQIDTSPIPGDPEATKRKAEQIRAAANAPASPSAQDRAVAADATSMAIKAQMEITRNQTEESSQNIDNSANNELLDYSKGPPVSQKYQPEARESTLLDVII
jgi:hypothetical protein